MGRCPPPRGASRCDEDPSGRAGALGRPCSTRARLLDPRDVFDVLSFPFSPRPDSDRGDEGHLVPRDPGEVPPFKDGGSGKTVSVTLREEVLGRLRCGLVWESRGSGYGVSPL